MMVLSATQTTALKEDRNHIGISHTMVSQLQNKGIIIVADLINFDKSTIKHIAANLRRPAGRIVDSNPGAVHGATIPVPPIVFGSKSQKRLVVADKMLCYYETVGYPNYTSNVKWNPGMKNFEFQRKALEEKKKRDEYKVPNIKKALPIIKWKEAFTDCTH